MPPKPPAPAPVDPAPAVRTTSDADGLITPVCAIFRRFLKKQNLRFTTERALILEAVMSKPGVFEADELYEEMLAQEARASRATIYRTLKHLLDAGIVREVLIDPGRAHYAMSFGATPKGHLVCVETDRVQEFPADRLDAFMREICAEYNFDPVSHRFVVYGVSPEARHQEQAESDSPAT